MSDITFAASGKLQTLCLQVAEMSNGKAELQERLSSLRASHERQSFEVHHLERAQAVGLQAARAASERMHRDILAAEAEVHSLRLFAA